MIESAVKKGTGVVANRKADCTNIIKLISIAKTEVQNAKDQYEIASRTSTSLVIDATIMKNANEKLNIANENLALLINTEKEAKNLEE